MSKDTPPAKKTLLLINTGSTKKRFILQRLSRIKDLKLVVVNKEKNWAERYVQDWIITDTDSHPKALRDIQSYAKQNKIDGVITFWEDDVLLCSKVADQLNLVGIPYSVSSNVRNKFEFRSFCEREGLPSPKNLVIKNQSALKSVSEKLQFPVVVKPVYGSSSAFVIKADNFEELEDVFSYVTANLSTEVESALHDGSQILIEEYIDGEEVDIDILLQNGKIKFWSIADNYQTQEPFFMETSYVIPSQLPDKAQEELVIMAEAVLEKLGIMNGCIHFEAKYSSRGPVPVEVNMRLGGDEIYPSVRDAWGVDLIEYAVKVALGEYFPVIKKGEEPKVHIFGQSIIPQNSGVVSSLSLPKSFAKNERIEEFHFYKEVGDAVYAPPLGYDFLGWMTASGDNPIDAEDNLQAAFKKVEFEIIPFSGESAVGKTKRTSPVSAASLTSAEAKKQARLTRLKTLNTKNQRKLHIGIACNMPDGKAGLVEAELFSVGSNIQKSLKELGYKTTFVDFNNVGKAISQLQTESIDLIFNVAERINKSSLLEPHVASILDALQLPYTGSNPLTLAFCIDKIKVKKLLTYHQIPTAKWDYVTEVGEAIRDDLKFPLIVKPANTDNSIGITQDSVVTNKMQLKKQVQYVLEELKCPALIEEYLSGDEYDVSIIGNGDGVRVLPLSRTVFKDDNKWNIYSFDSKFGDTSQHKTSVTVERPPKNVSSKLISLMSEIALDTYSILDAHDYARVEIKLDAENNPHVLELNPNPSINIPDCLPSVAKLMNIDYGQFLESLIAFTIDRYKSRDPYQHLKPRLG